MAPPTPEPGNSGLDEAPPQPWAPGPGGSSNGSTSPDDSELYNSQGDNLLGQSAVQWLDRAFALWRDGHFAASIDAMHEALLTQDLNDAGQALAYWHIYLAEQAMGHHARGQNALADFVAVANDMLTTMNSDAGTDAKLGEFAQQFDLAGRLARGRASLNLAWAKQTHHTGRSPVYPVLVFDEAEMDHFLDLVPPCARASDRQVVARERQQDPLGRPTARATIRCRKSTHDQHYFFAFIGGDNAVQKPKMPQARADDVPQ